MDKIIKVVPGFLANKYSSFVEATDVGAKIKELNKEKCEVINDKTVMDYGFDGTFMFIGFDNEKYLTVTIGSKSIIWDVVSIKPCIEGDTDLENIYFEYSKDIKVLWNWKEILDGFIGKKISISPSEQYLFIFVRGEEEYVFSDLINMENSNEHYLNISEA